MQKIVIWLVLSIISGCGWGIYALQQQYEEQSAEFRILYRDIAVKLSQHDAILSLMSASSSFERIQQQFPQILRWQQHSDIRPEKTLVPAGHGTYWLNSPRFSLLIDINTLIADLPQTQYFQQVSLSWDGVPLIEKGADKSNAYWQWNKTLVSQSQPFNLSVGNNPNWGELPWLMILISSLFWAVMVYFINKYRANKHQHDIANLRAHFSELTRLNAMGEITAGIIHELNQPLTAALSYNEAAVRLIQQQQTQGVPPLLDASVVQIKRINALLQQLRQKLTHDETALQPVQLNQIWLRVVMLLEKELRSGKITIVNRMSETLPELLADPIGVEQILHNILTNAIQAQLSMASGWVEVNAWQSGTGITLTITDGGSGLSEQALQEVFMPFYTTRVDGLGLGMTLTETLVQRLNGHIKVENIEGQGARFTVWLPLNPHEV
ncbi:sensor histidine kinase [Pragia fontium]|uniref:sensor histidine kinase n=1 Tax=Pragia fontium TaxID=82985 RepID=UPI00064B69D6|nr:ATP-binding protein [Pragia fontium]AKJ42179.1 histidine kinase [Pragia fontium]